MLSYSAAEAFHNGRAQVRKGSRYGCIDAACQLVIPREWDRADGFSEGLALVKKNDRFFYIDSGGSIVTEL